MTTVSILSAGTFDKFIEQVVEFRRLYINDHMKQGNMIPMMTNYLRYPNMLALCNLTTTEKVAVKERLDIVIEKYSIANHNFDIDNGFIWEDEIDQIKRLIEFMNQGDVGDKIVSIS